MKLFTLSISLLFLTNACRKNDNIKISDTDTTYVAPTDITRYTKPMAGKWLWKGFYEENYRQIDSIDMSYIIYINDTTIKFRDIIFTYKLRNPASDSDHFIFYQNPILENVGGGVEGISYIYSGDSIYYNRWWDASGGKYKLLYLIGKRIL